MNISALCLPAHKGLCGPMGAGLLVLGEDVPVKPLIFGGAGIASLDEGMPDTLPERLEAGTLPTPAAAGLLAGLRHVRKRGYEAAQTKSRMLAAELVNGLNRIGGFRTHGDTDGSVVSFTHAEMAPSEIGNALAERGICVRTGLHCAPTAHRTLGTEQTGTVRVSFGETNHATEIERILKVLGEIV